MITNFVGLCQSLSVEYIVAPYEADAQIAYLFKHGLVDGCITEDSDLLPFGCTKVLTNLDRYGYGKEIDLQTLQTAQLADNQFLKRLRNIIQRNLFLQVHDPAITLCGETG